MNYETFNAIVKDKSVKFIMRGTMKEVSREDMSAFDNGREYIFIIAEPEDGK